LKEEGFFLSMNTFLWK